MISDSPLGRRDRNEGFDFKNPDYRPVFARRAEMLRRILKDPAMLPDLRAYYRERPADYMNDWGMTFDPRNIELRRRPLVPFVLFPIQFEAVDFIMARWRAQERGFMPKTRDAGLSYIAMGLACTLCTFYDGMAIGFGSRKAEYVDKAGAPKSLFFKGRLFMQYTPKVFRGSWRADRDAPLMQIRFPDTNATISGEAGDGIGRGDRTALTFVDESAHLERPELSEASLSMTTNCRIDISSANGMANPFATQVHDSKNRGKVFFISWRDDPRKDQAWYDKKREELDAVTLAQEIDINFHASVEGALIPSTWVEAAIDAMKKLGIEEARGERKAGFDVADGGKDKNACAWGQGISLEGLDEWSGKGSDIFYSVERVFGLCDEHNLDSFKYDGDGLGAGVKGDARKLNEERAKRGEAKIDVSIFLGSGAVIDKSKISVNGKKNEDAFKNYKAQSWFGLRKLFQNTYRAVVEKHEVDLDDIISIPSTLPHRERLRMELAQITYKLTDGGLFVINKNPDNMPSPNLADAVNIWAARGHRKLVVGAGVVDRMNKEAMLRSRLGIRMRR